MPSPESLRLRSTLEKERIVPGQSLAEERSSWEDHARSLPLADGVACQSDLIGGVSCLWLRPAGAQKGVILYAHGGGLVSGSLITHRSFASHLAHAIGRSVLLVEYRLLPEHPADLLLEDMLSVFDGLLSGGFKPSEIGLGGDSNGAALSLSTALGLRDLERAGPACFLSFSGAFDLSLSGPTILSKSDVDPMLSEPVLRHWQSLLEPIVALTDPALSPLFADLHDLPPSLLFAGTDEVWLSDTTRIAQKIKAAGGQAQAEIYEGMWHVWPMWPDLPETRSAFERTKRFLDATLCP